MEALRGHISERQKPFGDPGPTSTVFSPVFLT